MMKCQLFHLLFLKKSFKQRSSKLHPLLEFRVREDKNYTNVFKEKYEVFTHAYTDVAQQKK